MEMSARSTPPQVTLQEPSNVPPVPNIKNIPRLYACPITRAVGLVWVNVPEPPIAA
uniref:Uncharacterized protein n=1 Tax=uncultured marine virus TaxID=186617 RepID=A0A0F7L8N9_9VIRU|nr:hypothetical protein [uncultured marine virus]